MNYASAQIVAYKGAAANSMMQLKDHFPDFAHTIDVVMNQLQGQLSGPNLGGQSADRNANLSSPLVGVEQPNSSLSV